MSQSSDWSGLSGRRALLAVAIVCAVVQMTSATLQTRSFDTPNAATWMAQNLARDGELSVAGLRAHQLPAEAIYLAAGFKLLPERARRYLHVPVTVLFATAIAAVALVVGGSGLAIATGFITSFDPFMIRHGPVWDDVMLAAAMEWSLFALLLSLAARAPLVRVSRGLLMTLAGLAAVAAMARSLSQVIILVVATLVIGLPRFRSLRPAGFAVLIGFILALGAWGTRNSIVLGSFEIGSTHDGEVLLRSNCRYTRQGIRELGMVGAFTKECLTTDEEHLLNLPELEFNRELRSYALDYIASNPVDVAQTAAFKLVVSLSGYDFAAPPMSLRNVIAVSSSLLTLVVGLCGLTLIWRQIDPSIARQLFVLLCLSTGALTLALLAIGPTGIRYRVGFSGFLYLGVALTVMHQMPLAWKRSRFVAGDPVNAVG